MAITVITAPTTLDLAVLADVKTELQITDSSQDIFLARLITEASQIVCEYCDRSFNSQRVKETVNAYGGTVITVSVTPIKTIHAIKDLDTGTTYAASDYAIQDASAGMIRNKVSGWQSTAQNVFGTLRTGVAGSEAPLIEVEYTGGYDSLPEVPFSIERAVKEIIKQAYMQRTTNPNVQSESVPDVYSVTYGANGDKGMYITGSMRSLLDKFKRVSL